MNKRQEELLNFCGYHINKNNSIIEENKDDLSNLIFDLKTKLFTISISEHTFNPGDHDSIEKFSIELNHKLGLIYELNMLKDKFNE